MLLPADLQQRAVEFAGLLAHPDVARRNVTAMPKWEKRRSLLLRRMAEKEVRPPAACLGMHGTLERLFTTRCHFISCFHGEA